MKKIYMTPSMRVGELDAQDLLCASPVGLCSTPALEDANDATQGSGLVKENNLWDVEW